MAPVQEVVYCTLLMSDSYLPGAMVLAHSLRDHGTRAKLVILVTLDTLKASTLDELKAIYDEIIPINRITNVIPSNLYLMERPDLIATFSKVELWKQTQYKQIVYIDADVVALRAPDELLSLDTNFAAVPDIGWPDCFNTGLMVLRPNLQDYYSLLALAQRGISFDGADQGLLNMHFGEWKRLSFTYNCTPSGNYQYVPAFRHFQSTISLVHYIGQQKPWQLPRTATPAESPYSQLLGRWWATYDRHYRPELTTATIQHTPSRPPRIKLQHVTEGPITPRIIPQYNVSETGEISRKGDISAQESSDAGNFHMPISPISLEGKSALGHFERLQHAGHQPGPSDIHPSATDVPDSTNVSVSTPQDLSAQPPEQYQSFETPHFSSGTSTSESIPSPSPETTLSQKEKMAAQKPIALEIPQNISSAVPQYVRGEEHVAVYRQPYPEVESSIVGTDAELPRSGRIFPSSAIQSQLIEDIKPIEVDASPIIEERSLIVDTPLEHPHSPPRFYWDASRGPPPAGSKPEGLSLPSHTYTMSQDTQLFQPPKSYPDAPKNMYYEVPPRPPISKKPARLFPWEEKAPTPSRVFTEDTPEDHEKLGEPGPPVITGNQRHPEERVSSQRLWQTYVRSNAWDEIPEIERYMRSIQQPRKSSIQIISGSPSLERRGSTRITDFPSSTERPSLPVTPAPISRRYGWKGTAEEEERTGEFPAAEGVPDQAEWNPMVSLEDLRRRSSTFLEWPIRDRVREISKRDMPESESLGNRSTHS